MFRLLCIPSFPSKCLRDPIRRHPQRGRRQIRDRHLRAERQQQQISSKSNDVRRVSCVKLVSRFDKSEQKRDVNALTRSQNLVPILAEL